MPKLSKRRLLVILGASFLICAVAAAFIARRHLKKPDPQPVDNTFSESFFTDKFEPVSFPPEFMWGVAMSAYQTGSINPKSDWWEWEKARNPVRINEPTDNYHDRRWYERDDAIAASLSITHYRTSIEWAQIEPGKGVWDKKEIAHYRRLFADLKKRHIEPIICLNHFVLPKWVADEGGWENPETVKHFAHYVEKVAEEIGRPLKIKIWLTFNEPTIPAICGYIGGEYPPGRKNDWKAARLAVYHITRAHKAAYTALHRILDTPEHKIQVGIAGLIASFVPHSNSTGDTVVTHMMDFISNKAFFEVTEDYQDFIGLNYYREYTLKLNTRSSWFLTEYTNEASSPTGLYRIIKGFQLYKKPIIITENGINAADERTRIKFIASNLLAVRKAMDEGADVRGYFVWALTDTYEWNRGYTTHFGMVGIDRITQDRVVRKGAYFYKDIIENNGFSAETVRDYLESPEK
jgi:beta-glucosidase